MANHDQIRAQPLGLYQQGTGRATSYRTHRYPRTETCGEATSRGKTALDMTRFESVELVDPQPFEKRAGEGSDRMRDEELGIAFDG